MEALLKCFRFLLARLYVDQLTTMVVRGQVEFALSKMFKVSDEKSQAVQAYDEQYELALKRIISQSGDQAILAKATLTWMTFACAPLTPNGLCSILALSLSDNRRELDQAFVPEIDIVLSVCAGLVTVDEDANVVRLVHYTTQEYLARTHGQWLENGQKQTALACIRYLSLDVFKYFEPNQKFVISKQSYQIRSEKYPFLDYAARHWAEHAWLLEPELVDEIYSMVQHAGIQYSIGSVTCRTSAVGDNMEWGHWDGVAIVAGGGLHHTLRRHFYDLHLTAKEDILPLLIASYQGWLEVVKVILGHELAIHYDIGCTKALFACCSCEDTEMIQVILDYWDIAIPKGRIPADVAKRLVDNNFISAASSGLLKVVQFLYDRIVDRNIIDEALKGSVLKYHEAVVRFPIGRGANLKWTMDQAIDSFFRPKPYADLRGLRLLLRMRVEADSRLPVGQEDGRRPNGQSALQLSAEQNEVGIMRVLLEHNADINLRSGIEGLTALEAACRSGRPEAVDFLLDKGACVPNDGISFESSENSRGLCLFSGDWSDSRRDKSGVRVFEILRKRGVKMIAKDERSFEVAALGIIESKMPGVLREWLKLGDECQIQSDDSGRVSSPSRSTHREPYTSKRQECIAILLDHGANSTILDGLVNVACNSDMWLPMLEMLFAAGVDLRKYGSKALHKQTVRRRFEIVVWLLENGADISAAGEQYPNLLLTSVAWPDGLTPRGWAQVTSMVKALIGHGADVQKYGQAAFELAIASSNAAGKWKCPPTLLNQLEEMLTNGKS
jgi:hypothetical protein